MQAPCPPMPCSMSFSHTTHKSRVHSRGNCPLLRLAVPGGTASDVMLVRQVYDAFNNAIKNIKWQRFGKMPLEMRTA